MRYKWYFATLAILLPAIAAEVFAGIDNVWIAVTVAAASAVTLLLHSSVSRPLHAVQNGIYLLREQDFSSRLRRVGQSDADKAVELFNSLMDTMKAERLKLLEQNKFLSQITEVSPMGIAICDFNGNITQSNKAYKTFVTPQVSKEIDKLNEEETRVIRAGMYHIFRCSRLWFMDSGFRRQFILVERLTDEIAQAEKQMFNKTVRTIGHEVNNTLGSVVSLLETLHDIHEKDPEIARAIMSSSDSCLNLVNFVKQYADLVKLPAPVPEEVDLNAEMTRMMPFLHKMAPNNISIRFDLWHAPVTVKADMTLMERVVVNIVTNSIESIGNNSGTILLKTAPGKLEITDNGRGIDDESARKLFTPFFSTKHPDRGLGLMLIADILRSHKAEFYLATDKDSRLTTFHISFGN